jgi:BMFP domain-containing protein YqiC
MAITFWDALKVSPALLGALFVANSADAAESLSEREVAIASGEEIASVEKIAVSELSAVEEVAVSELTAPEASLDLSQTESVIAQQVPAAEAPTDTSREVLQQIDRYSNEGYSDSLDQVTNVSQLSDVSPGDWAFEALRSLVERYGCIAGYPDGTYRGNRALTRYEFAAGLNACLQQIESLIAGLDFVTREDLETLQRLVQEFEAELATLGTRVDNLEGRVAFLEDNQFSTTTKLNGEVIFALSGAYGDDIDENEVFQDRVRLNLDTSFTGRDRLRTRLQARNVQSFDFTGDITNEGRRSFEGDNGNDVEIDYLGYRFPVGDNITAQIFANGVGLDDLADPLNPLNSSGGGSISRFGERNPIYRVGGQNAGVGLTFDAGPLIISAGYTAGEAEDPGEGAGVFNGDYAAIGQVTFSPFDALSVAAVYVHSYSDGGLGHGTGSFASDLEVVDPFTGDDLPVVGNSYGLEASFAFSPQLILTGWIGYTDAILIGRGDAEIWNYAATLAINDFGSEGSTLGFVFGQEPRLTDVDGLVPLDDDDDIGFHVQGFYKLALNDNIEITPGVIWLTAPGHNDANDDIFVGTIRTRFRF